MNTAVAEVPEPEDERGTGLITGTSAGTNRDMEAENTKAYTVTDEFRISWLNKHLREDHEFGGVRDSIHDKELTEPAARYILPYLDYLVYEEHGILAEEAIDRRVAVETNFGKDTIYCTYKVVA